MLSYNLSNKFLINLLYSNNPPPHKMGYFFILSWRLFQGLRNNITSILIKLIKNKLILVVKK